VNSQFVQLIASLQKNSQESSRPKGNQVGPGKLTRRNFCGRILLTLTALFLLAKKLIGRPSSQLSHQLAYPPMKIQDAESVMPGSFLNFNYPGLGDPAILVRAPDGEYFAHSRKCAHLGCSVDFDRARRCLDCPCHHGAYDPKTGSVLYGPPTRSLDAIVLQMRAGGEVWAVGKGIGSGNTA